MIIRRPNTVPIREESCPDILWRSEDKGLIHAWELGRREAVKSEELVNAVLKGELPPLLFKGGYKNQLDAKFQYGSLHYYCMLQGLKGSDLEVDLDKEYPLVCSRTGMGVVYTLNSTKYLSTGIKKKALANLDASFVRSVLAMST